MLENSYAQHYAKNRSAAVYPVEFVVRAFLGTYPGWAMPRKNIAGKTVLDLGFGDGRNAPLLHNLGLRISGVEISESIVRQGRARLKKLGIPADLKVGKNSKIPYPDEFFSYVLACHSCYYVEKGRTFNDNVKEMHRVLKAGGSLIASLPHRGTYLLKGAKRLPDGHYRVTQDPYGLRQGTCLRGFSSKIEIQKTLGPYFGDLRIGCCDDNYWGIHQKVWILVGTRR